MKISKFLRLTAFLMKYIIIGFVLFLSTKILFLLLLAVAIYRNEKLN